MRKRWNIFVPAPTRKLWDPENNTPQRRNAVRLDPVAGSVGPQRDPSLARPSFAERRIPTATVVHRSRSAWIRSQRGPRCRRLLRRSSNMDFAKSRGKIITKRGPHSEEKNVYQIKFFFFCFVVLLFVVLLSDERKGIAYLTPQQSNGGARTVRWNRGRRDRRARGQGR